MVFTENQVRDQKLLNIDQVLENDINPENIVVMDITRINHRKDTADLKLAFAVLAKMRVYQGINKFLENIDSKNKFNPEILNVVLNSIINEKGMTDKEIKLYFKQEKKADHFEQELYNVCGYQDINLTYFIDAYVLGVDPKYLYSRSDKDAREIGLAYDEFGDAAHEYYKDKITYEEFLKKAKASLFHVVRE